MVIQMALLLGAAIAVFLDVGSCGATAVADGTARWSFLLWL